MKNDVIEHINYMVSKNYYLLLILEDLETYFKFKIYKDISINDVRNIILYNNKNEQITINSKIISYNSEHFSQFNKILFLNINKKEINWSYIGNCYKKN